MKINFILFTVFISFVIFAGSGDEPNGIVGLTEKDGGTGCICHSFEKNDSVNVWLEGPDSIYVSDSSNFRLYLTGGPAVKGGFNVAALLGKLNSLDTLTHLIEYVSGDTQLTHTQPLVFSGDTIFWDFKYYATDSLAVDTIFSVANSVNGDGNPGEDDKWNFGPKFIVNVIDRPNGVGEHFNTPVGFTLNQNYPNPFNPKTIISFNIPIRQNVSIKIYDINGNEISTLFNGILDNGYHQFEFDAKNQSSGIYFYKILTDKFSSTKKMVLLK